MKSALILIATAAIAVTGCSAQPAAPALAAANSGRQCFLARQVNGYTSVSDQIVDVKVAANRYFRLSLDGSCPQADFSRRVILRTTGGSDWICQGLDAEQLARRSVPPSSMSLLGLLRHLGEVERDWRNWITSGGGLLARIYGPHDADFDQAVTEPGCVAQALEVLDAEQRATDQELAQFQDLGQSIGREHITVRELQVHRIEEYARHCGHADLLRECIDGRTGE